MTDAPVLGAPVLDAPETTAPAAAPVLGGVVAYLCVEGALKAAEFYERAFGARTASAYPPDESGPTMHVHVHLNGASLMLSDPYPEHGCGHVPLQGFNLMLPVDDADAWAERALAAGCEVVMPVQDMFWGDRYGQFRDPFGVLWAVNQGKS